MTEKNYTQMLTEYLEYCNKCIKPYLPEYEKMRRNNSIHKLLGIIGLISFPLAFISGIFHQIIIAAFFAVITVLDVLCCIILPHFIPYDARRNIMSNFEDNLKIQFMRQILKIFSDNSGWKKGVNKNYYSQKIQEYKNFFIFNSFPWMIFDDTIYLEHKNTKINIFEVNTSLIFNIYALAGLFFAIVFFLVSPLIIIILIVFIIYRKKILKIIGYAPFKGVVVEMEMKKNFSGHTYFHEKSKTSKMIPVNRSKYEPVSLESSDFMEKYNVYSTDQVEARYLLTTAMIDRLNNLKLAFKANFIRGSFKDNKLILAIDTGKDMFAMGSDFKESNTQTFINFYNEITSVMKIVDQLKLDEKTGL